MTRTELNRYLARGRDVLSAGFVPWARRAAFGAVAVGWTCAFTSLAEASLPPEDINIAEWAQKYRYVGADSGSRLPGKWDNANSPYAIEPMEAMSPDHPAKGVVLKWASQVAKSEVGCNVFGHAAHISHLPMLITQAGTVEVNKFNRFKLTPMIESTPVLREAVEGESDKSGKGSTTRFKAYPGGGCLIASALASSALQAITRAIYWGDEVSEYPAETGKRGDPVQQAITRLEEYGDTAKWLLTSTCQFKHSCKITNEYDKSDQRQLYVPCPHCDDYQILVFDNLGWSTGLEGVKIPVYSCASCGTDIIEADKTEMVRAGIWVPTFKSKNPENPQPPQVISPADIEAWHNRDREGNVIWGYHLWKAYALRGEWSAILGKYEEAEGDPEALKVFWQQTLAEAWDDSGEAPDHAELAKRVESYAADQVPTGAYFVTGAMDVQKDVIKWSTYAWGPNMQGWLLEKGVLMGDTDQPDVWADARELWVTKSYKYGSGLNLPVDLWGVDSGYRSDYVYHATKGFPNVINLDGRGADKPHAPPLSNPKIIEHRIGKVRMGRVEKYDVGTYNLKSRLYGMLRQWKEGPDEVGKWPRGIIHFNAEADEEFFQELTAEVLVQNIRRGGRVTYFWQKLKQRPNDYHDIAVYNLALACSMRWDTRRPEEWQAWIDERGQSPQEEQASLEALWGPGTVAIPADQDESKLNPRMGHTRAAGLSALARLAQMDRLGDDD